MEKVKDYAFSAEIEAPYEQVLPKVTQALQEQGFGVITEIDVKATLQEKLGQEFRQYRILGACNPGYAFRSLQADLDVGLLLPCNVIVYEIDQGRTYVAAINPVSALEVIQSTELRAIAAEVSQKLQRVIASLTP